MLYRYDDILSPAAVKAALLTKGPLPFAARRNASVVRDSCPRSSISQISGLSYSYRTYNKPLSLGL